MRNIPQIPPEFSHYSNKRSIAERQKKEDQRYLRNGLLFILIGMMVVFAIVIFFIPEAR